MTHGWAGHHGKAVRPPQTGVHDMSANVPAPRARTHRQRRRRHALIVFTACDQRFHVAGGGHGVLLRQDDDLHGRRWNTNMECRSTSGRFSRAAGPGCDQGSTALSRTVAVGSCTARVTTKGSLHLQTARFKMTQQDGAAGGNNMVGAAQLIEIIDQGIESRTDIAF